MMWNLLFRLITNAVWKVNTRSWHFCLFLGIASLSSACNQLDFAGATQSEKSERKSEDADAADPDDMVNIPVNVTGSYLACAIRKEAKADDPGRQVGCRLNDPETGEKLNLKQYSESVDWLISPAELASIEVLDDHPVWHAFYLFSTTEPQEADQWLAQASFQVQLSLKDVNQKLRIESEAVSALRPIEEFNDFEAPIVIERGIAPETPGPL